MEFEIRELDRSEEALAAVFEVCRDAFAHVSVEKLKSNWLDSHSESTFIGAFSGHRLAAVNGFVAHPILIDGVRSLAFQSCWSATRKDFRGKGLFSRIINAGKDMLGRRGKFIFGFPNSVSGPIFTGKLGFRETPMRRVVLLARGPEVLLDQQISAGKCYEALADRRLVKFDQAACARWKRSEHAGNLVEVEHNTNFLWGVSSVRRVFGVEFKTLLVGGCEVNKPVLFGRLIQQAAKASGASFLRFVCSEGSPLAESGRWVMSGHRTEPLIHFPLSEGLGDCRFDAHVGLKDVY